MPKITFAHTGTTLDVATGASYLEACKAADAPQDFGCTVGSCGTCVCVLEGTALVGVDETNLDEIPHDDLRSILLHLVRP